MSSGCICLWWWYVLAGYHLPSSIIYVSQSDRFPWRVVESGSTDTCCSSYWLKIDSLRATMSPAQVSINPRRQSRPAVLMTFKVLTTQQQRVNGFHHWAYITCRMDSAAPCFYARCPNVRKTCQIELDSILNGSYGWLVGLHWLVHLVQRGGDWAGCGPPNPLLALPNVTARGPPINGQCTNFILCDVALQLPLNSKGLNPVAVVEIIAALSGN